MTPLSKLFLLLWIVFCSNYHSVDPTFSLAVAHIESRINDKEFRLGRLGNTEFFGPFGISECFLNRWQIDNPWINCWYGVQALKGPNKRKTLQRYNLEFNEPYWTEVKRAQVKYDELLSGSIIELLEYVYD